jgi:anhydro-N-acetylmuramic acid kinase
MLLTRLLQKRVLVVVGLNSGTSADGADLVAVKSDRGPRQVKTTYLGYSRSTYPSELRKAVLDAADSSRLSLDQVIRLHDALGQFYARSVKRFLTRLRKNKITVDAVATHGQTVLHLPGPERLAGFETQGTLQLGLPERIAAAADKVVISDFRQADCALGNEGAPITVAAMERLFAHPGESRLIVNIGGMSNFCYFPLRRSSRSVMAADCGPGNSLCDILADRLFGQPFDRGGALGRSGSISQRLLALLMGNNFFRESSQSTGREQFGRILADKMIESGKRLSLSHNDLLATAAQFTATAISTRIRPVIRPDAELSKLYLTGGGERNSFLKELLRRQLPELQIRSISELGYKPQAVEAAAFAVMGESCLRSEPVRTRYSVRGSQNRKPVLGRIIQPPVKV